MKVAPILAVLCLTVSLQQSTAAPSIFDAISDGIKQAGSVAEGIAGSAGSAASGIAGTAGDIASGIAQGAKGVAQGTINTATGIAKGFIGTGTGIASGIADQAGKVSKSISELVKKVKNQVLKGSLQKAQTTLEKIQDQSRGILQSSEVAAKNAAKGVIEVENQKNAMIQEWADKAQQKLANASPETQEKGQDLINSFVSNRAEAISQASEKVLKTLEDVQEKANATASKYHEPMNKLIEQVGKCSELKVSQIRELVKCGQDVAKDLGPLMTAPAELAKVKAELGKAGIQNIVKDVRVQKALSQFRDQSKQVDAILDQLVAQDQKKQEQDGGNDNAGNSEQSQDEGNNNQNEDQAQDSDAEAKEGEQQSQDQASEDQAANDQASNDQAAEKQE